MVKSNFKLKKAHKNREEEDFYPKHVPTDHHSSEDETCASDSKNLLRRYKMVKRTKRKYGVEEEMIFPSEELKKKIIEEIKRQRHPWYPK